MRRRRFIGGAGSAMLAAVAGCISGNDDEPSTGSEDDGTPTDETPDGDDPFVDASCPSFSDSADRTVCAHKDHDADVYPTLSEQVFAPTTGDDSVETLQIQLHNESDSNLGLNPHEWALKRQTDDGWEHVAPEEYIEPWYTVKSGEVYTWLVSVETHPSPSDDRTLSVVEDLDAGTYAFQVTGVLEGDADDGPRIECIGLFEVERE